MKLLLLNHSFPPIIGGGQTYLFNLASILPNYGIEVDVVTGILPQIYSENDVPKINGKIYRIAGYKEYSKGVGDFKKIIEQLYAIVKESNPDIIYTHGYMSCVLASQIKPLLPNTRIVFTYHSTPIPQDNKYAGIFSDAALDLSFCQYVFRQCHFDLLIAQSKHYQDFALQNGAPSERILLNYLGVDLSIFRKIPNPSPYFHKKPDNIYICLPVRMIRRKGIEEALQALAQLPTHYHLILVTSTDYTPQDYEARIDRLIKDLKLSDRVQILKNTISFSQMPDIYSACDITLMPAYIEGLGLGSIESMACGTPVIGANTSGTAEIIINGENGLLFEPGNATDLAECILAMSNEELRNKIIAKGYKTVNTSFNADRQIQKIATILAEMQPGT